MAGYRKIMFTQWLKSEEVLDVHLTHFRANCECIKTDPRILYALLGLETGKTGKPHMHGYLVFENPVMYSRVKRLLNDNTIHCEAARGTASEAKDYIFHTGKHADKVGQLYESWEYGQAPHDEAGRPEVADADQSYKSLVEAILKGRSDAELMPLYPALYIRHFSNIQRIRDAIGVRGGFLDVELSHKRLKAVQTCIE